MAAAISLVGTRWRWQGRDPATGLDCAGVVVATGRLAGLACDEPTPRYACGAAAAPEVLRGFLDSFLEPSAGAVAPGDMLLLSLDGRPQHAAVMVALGEIVHALPGHPRRVVRERLAQNGRMRLVAAYSFRGIASD